MKKLLTFFLSNILLAGLFLLLLFKAAHADTLFGKDNISGVSSQSPTTGREYGSVYTCTKSGTIYYLEIYCGATGNDIKLGVYSADGSTLLCQTASFTAAAGWNKVATTTNISVTSGTSYGIAMIVSANATNQLKRTIDGTGIYMSSGVTWPTLLSSVTVLGSNNYAMFAEDNIQSSPTNTPTITPTMTASPTPTCTVTTTAVSTPIHPWYPYRWTSASITGQPQAICAYNNKIWVTINSPSDPKVLEIDPETLATLHTMNLGVAGGGPQSIHGFGGYVWTGDVDGSTMSRIDVSTYSVLNASLLYGSPNGITDDGTYLYLACMEWGSSHDIIAKIDPATFTEVSNVHLGGTNGSPYGICYTGTKFVVGMFQAQTVVIVDAATATVVATIDVPITNGPCDINYYAGSAWVASWGDGVLWKINPDTFSVQTIPLDFFLPGYSWVIYGCTSGGGYVWATDYEAGRLHKVRPSDGLDVGWADCSMNPQGVCYYNGYLYTADALTHAVVKINAGEDYPYGPITGSRSKQDLGMWDSWKKKIKTWWNGI